MGSSGSGKSTFAQRLSAITGIPTVSLDALYWKPGWIAVGCRRVRRHASRKPRASRAGSWTAILCRTMPATSAAALPTRCSGSTCRRRTCMTGILTRIATSYGRVRPEMAAGCPEKIDFDFFRYVWTYRRLQRPKMLQYFEGLRPISPLICFTNRTQADQYLAQCRAGRRRSALTDAALFQQAAGASHRAADVRSGRRRRALSRIRAAVPFAENSSADAASRWHRNRRRRHDGVVQAGAGILHQPGDAGPCEPEDHGGIPEGAVQQSGKPLDFRAQIRNRLRCRVFPVL